MVVHFPALHQPAVKAQGIEAPAVYPGRQVVADPPSGRPALPSHGEHVGGGTPLLSGPAQREAGRPDREIAQLRVIPEGLADTEGRGAQPGEEKGVREKQCDKRHGGNIS